jgi:predicted RNA-binding protein associated with RNAse of E/G family
MPGEAVIRYRRLPDRVQIFHQRVLEESRTRIVSFLESADLLKPLLAGGRTILEPGAPVIWFTYPCLWFDIGAFHRADGTLTGYYANVLTPPVMLPDGWETTDLCLDVWSGADGEVVLLDESDLEEALLRGWVDESTAAIARAVAGGILEAARAGVWPPAHVRRWSLTQL